MEALLAPSPSPAFRVPEFRALPLVGIRERRSPAIACRISLPLPSRKFSCRDSVSRHPVSSQNPCTPLFRPCAFRTLRSQTRNRIQPIYRWTPARAWAAATPQATCRMCLLAKRSTQLLGSLAKIRGTLHTTRHPDYGTPGQCLLRNHYSTKSDTLAPSRPPAIHSIEHSFIGRNSRPVSYNLFESPAPPRPTHRSTAIRPATIDVYAT